MRRYRRVFVIMVVTLMFFSAGATASPKAPAGAGVPQVPPGFVQIFIPPYASDRFVVDLRYATDDNFMHRNLYAPYGIDRCWLHADAADRLMKIIPLLKERKLKLVLWDCWRPNAVQKEMWKIMPDPRYVADPVKGSNHNRGMAIDCTLADDRGRPLPMPTPFDDFSTNADPAYRCDEKGRERCRNRDLQIRLMQAAGFTVNPAEWWHYQPTGADLKRYPVY